MLYLGIELVINDGDSQGCTMYPQLVLSSRHRDQPVKGYGAHVLHYFNGGLGIWYALNFLHTKERLSLYQTTATGHGEVVNWRGWR